MLTTRKRILICIIVVVLVLTQVPYSSAPTLVDLDYARYQGVRSTKLGVTTFYGLRYAAPPTGKLRWQPPLSIEEAGLYKDSPLISATSPGNICHQSKPTWQKRSAKQDQASTSHPKRSTADSIIHNQSEDCLQLDVITPSNPSSKSLPVVVFIHGGGYVKGYAAQYDGQNFVSFSKGSLVWVQIHYRLGLFGFLGGDEINRSGSPNVGLLDQQLALQWVQSNIARFGGDPHRVTIWGGSAGGASVLSQMILHSDRPEPPFRAAIAEYPWWQPYHQNDVLQAQYKDLLVLTDCNDIACLRDLSESALAKAQQGVYDRGWEGQLYGFGDFYFGPYVDGKVVPRLPHLSLDTGNFAKVPLLTDHTGFEGFTFTNKFINQHLFTPTYLERLWPQCPKDLLADLFKLYPEDTFTGEYFNDPIFKYLISLDEKVENNSAFFRTQTIFSDGTINCPSRSIAKALTKAGQNVWKMHFRAGSQLHAAVTKEHLLAPKGTRSTRQLKSYFLAFITSLDPNGHIGLDRPAWPVYSSENRVLLINESGISTTDDSDAGAHCDFFADNHASFGY